VKAKEGVEGEMKAEERTGSLNES